MGFNPANYDNNKPFTSAIAITPSDTTVLTEPLRGLYVGGLGGTVSVVMASGQTVTFSGVGTGTTLNICYTKVRSTGTTATNILGLY